MKIFLDSPFLPSQQTLYDSASPTSGIGPLPVYLTTEFESALPDLSVGTPVKSRLPFWLVVGSLVALIYFAVK